MSIEDKNSIDVVSIDANGLAVLTISDHLEWDKENSHLLKLQDKVNAYFGSIDNGSLYKSYPDAKGRKIVINFVAKYLPNEDGKLFLERISKVLESGGFSFKFTLLPG
jgi:hypothetical protein